MKFQEVLAGYMERLHCSARELAEASGLSEASVSRYRSGGRRPSPESGQLRKLAKGIVALAKERESEGFDELNVWFELAESARENEPEELAGKLDMLIQALHINVARMARAMNYDASFFSKIRRNQRFPSDPEDFAGRLSAYVAEVCPDEPSRKILAELIGCPPEELRDGEAVQRQLGVWFLSGKLSMEKQRARTLEFLQKLDGFDLKDYLRAIRFDQSETSAEPVLSPATGVYRGTGGQQRAELEFLKGVIAAESRTPLFMYSDMDMADMSVDKDFLKKWMMGLAGVLKKRQPVSIIHNLNRPFYELMLGLEAYIPLYMTGLFSPYYFKGEQNAVFRHSLCVSENYALSGEAVADYHDQGRFYLTDQREEVAYYRERADLLLKKAEPLMDIYTEERRAGFERFQESDRTEKGERHFISSSLPVFTLSQEKLVGILQRAGVPEEKRSVLTEYAARKRGEIEQALTEYEVLDQLPLVSGEEYREHPLVLSFSDIFEEPIPYSYEDYISHLEETQRYAEEHPAYRIQFCPDFAFRNVQIDILEGKRVWISKVGSSAIHFVIYQPQLRGAIEKMYIALKEEPSSHSPHRIL